MTQSEVLAMRYRPSGDLCLSTRRIRAVATATAAICQRDWTRHHPSRAIHG